MVGWKSTLASSRSLNWHTHEEKSLHGKSHLLPDRASTVTTSIPVYLPLTHSTRSVSLLELTTVSRTQRSEEHTSELQSLMRISYAVFCLKKKKIIKQQNDTRNKYRH